MKNRKPWSFCETPEEKCTMNYCDENGCQNRKRNYVEGNDLIADVVSSEAKLLPKGCSVCNAEIRNDVGDGLCAECWSRQ